MLVGCVGLLIAVSGFLTELPPLFKAHLESTNEVSGVFEQVKVTPERSYVTKGDFRLRPGRDFIWRTREPFATTFYATPTNYVYSNEDESVSRALESLPFFSRFGGGRPDPQEFFKVFDALYKEEGGRFYLKAKPKIAELARVLERIEAEGVLTNWTFRAVFTNRQELRIRMDAPTGGR